MQTQPTRSLHCTLRCSNTERHAPCSSCSALAGKSTHHPPSQDRPIGLAGVCLPACNTSAGPHATSSLMSTLPSATNSQPLGARQQTHAVPSTTFHTSSKATSLGELALSIATHNTCMPHTCQRVQHTASYILPPAWPSVSLHQVPSQRSQDHTIPARTKTPVTLLQARCTAR
jgi:hypothetical protein